MPTDCRHVLFPVFVFFLDVLSALCACVFSVFFSCDNLLTAKVRFAQSIGILHSRDLLLHQHYIVLHVAAGPHNVEQLRKEFDYNARRRSFDVKQSDLGHVAMRKFKLGFPGPHIHIADISALCGGDCSGVPWARDV